MPSGRSPPPASGSSPAAPDQAGRSLPRVPRASLPARPLHPTPQFARRLPLPHLAHPRWRGQADKRGEERLRDNLVVQNIEAESRLRLRLAVELSLKAPDLGNHPPKAAGS